MEQTTLSHMATERVGQLPSVAVPETNLEVIQEHVKPFFFACFYFLAVEPVVLV